MKLCELEVLTDSNQFQILEWILFLLNMFELSQMRAISLNVHLFLSINRTINRQISKRKRRNLWFSRAGNCPQFPNIFRIKCDCCGANVNETRSRGIFSFLGNSI